MARKRENIFDAARRFTEELFSGTIFSSVPDGGNDGNSESRGRNAAGVKDHGPAPAPISPEIRNTLEVLVGKYVNDLLSQQRDLIKMHDEKIHARIDSQDMKVSSMIADQDNKVDSRLEGHTRKMRAALSGASMLAMFVLGLSAVIIFTSIIRYDKVNRELAEVRQSQSEMVADAGAAISGLEENLKDMQQESRQILGAVAAGAGAPGAAPEKKDMPREIQENLLAMNDRLKEAEGEARALRERLAKTDAQMQSKFDKMDNIMTTGKTTAPEKEKPVTISLSEEPDTVADKQLTAQDYFHAGFAEKDPHARIELFTKAVEADPQFAMAFNERGNAYAELGRFGLALADLSKAIDLKPLARYYTDRGAVLNLTGDYNLAIRDFGEALILDEENAAAYNNRGIAYEKKGDPARALADYDMAISLSPQMYAAHARRINILSSSGMKKETAEALKSAAAAGFNRPELLDTKFLSGPEFRQAMEKIRAGSK